MKLKELLSGLSSLALSEAEAISVIALLREKSPTALDAWHKVRSLVTTNHTAVTNSMS